MGCASRVNSRRAYASAGQLTMSEQGRVALLSQADRVAGRNMPNSSAHHLPLHWPIHARSSPAAPSALRCLKCQLSGHRSALCFRADACGELPHGFPMATLLIFALASMTLVFLLTIG
jgi:hypothetical protein